MRNILLNDSSTHDLISWYYSNPSRSFPTEGADTAASTARGAEDGTQDKTGTSTDPSEGAQSSGASDGPAADGSGGGGVTSSGATGERVYPKKELVRIANQLFMQSIYLPSILHYGKVFGEHPPRPAHI
jgi:hypothetical protein